MKPGGSIISWTRPQATDVISYAYLWAREAAKGREEGAKDRPAVVVLATVQMGERIEVFVAPVTTQMPREPSGFVEIPISVKRHLGLDDQRSWIVAEELNRFMWPGPDVRPVGGGNRTPYYGKIPEKLLERIRKEMRAARLRIIKRTE